MTAFVYSGAANSPAQSEPWMGNTRDSLVEIMLDFSSRKLSAAGYAAGDTIKVMGIPKGTLVQNLVTTVVVPEGAALTMSVGDSGSATRFHSALTLNSAAGTQAASAAVAQLYAADDYLLLTIGGTLLNSGTGKVSIVAQVVDVSNRNNFGPL